MADQNLAADYFAEFPSEFPTTATKAVLIHAAGNAASASMDEHSSENRV